jgi:MacB-like periplasmic core domain
VSFVLALAVVTGIGFGLVPALQASRSDVVYALKEDTSGGRRRAWLRGVLVVVQLALSFVLLITAGLTVRSLEHTQALGPGFDPNNAVTMSVDLGMQGYDETRGENFYQQLAEHVRGLPGVKSAGWIARLPLALDVSTTDVYPEGQAEPRAEEIPSAIYESVSPDYFAAMRIPIVGGRDFVASDIVKSPGVVIVNETLAGRFWPGQNAIGKRLHSGNTDVLEVVGVAKNTSTRAWEKFPRWSSTIHSRKSMRRRRPW